MSLTMYKKVPKMGAQKWPRRGPLGPPGWAIWGVFWAFSGHSGLLDVILDRHAAAGPATRINVLKFRLSWPVFVLFRQYFGQFLLLWCHLVPFCGLLGSF